MLLGKKRKLGRRIEEINKGEKLTLTEKMEDKDLLLYLGLTNDANPLYVQHDYASQTTYEKPIVPPIMLTGIITSAISKYLPGPGSYIVKQDIDFINPVYHYDTIQFLFEVIDVNMGNNMIQISVRAVNENEDTTVQALISVCPPQKLKEIDGKELENF
ncbi:MaoC/PaaZ C-terminal domain-containing protein [Bacillus dakarensis]|uniref:MaoC/PaaZ C-terminal domain-containing protein n=1 Tax=Robertmurraya dakarensis TaxID=1926278 RepID=UPI000982685D|nr:MaoC/PaaZ C-terminal domain-containing protein [Bacillus dakarensis]